MTRTEVQAKRGSLIKSFSYPDRFHCHKKETLPLKRIAVIKEARVLAISGGALIAAYVWAAPAAIIRTNDAQDVAVTSL